MVTVMITDCLRFSVPVEEIKLNMLSSFLYLLQDGDEQNSMKTPAVKCYFQIPIFNHKSYWLFSPGQCKQCHLSDQTGLIIHLCHKYPAGLYIYVPRKDASNISGTSVDVCVLRNHKNNMGTRRSQSLIGRFLLNSINLATHHRRHKNKSPLSD